MYIRLYRGLVNDIGMINGKSFYVYVDDNFTKTVIPKNPNAYKVLNKTEWNGYGFKIGEVEEIRTIEINGKQSLWRYDYNAKGE